MKIESDLVTSVDTQAQANALIRMAPTRPKFCNLHNLYKESEAHASMAPT